MNTLTKLYGFGALCVALVATPVAAKPHDHAMDSLSAQTTAGVLWVQQSGEYRGLALQTFNMAKQAFDNAKAKNGKTKAVIVDLDETMIDNSAYAAWQVHEKQPYSGKTWTQWVESRDALAVPGAVDFAKHVVNHGGKIFYVSNRKVGAEYQPTLDNLKALGFPTVNEKTVLLKEKSSNKDARFERVRSMGVDVVIHIGDNLGDFAGEGTYHKSNADRRAFVDAHQKDFGVSYFLVPNPNYGAWEGGLDKGYYKLSTDEKLKLRRDTLRTWKP